MKCSWCDSERHDNTANDLHGLFGVVGYGPLCDSCRVLNDFLWDREAYRWGGGDDQP